MDKIDNEIKQRLVKDKIMSEKAENLFKNFIKGGNFMENNNIKEFPTKEEKIVNKSSKSSKFKNLIAIAACMLAILGGGQIYASTQGYGNVFFLVKYLVTGQKTEIAGKENILSDRDITISYEPIQLTEKIKMQVRNIQIKDNKAKLFLAISENPLESNTTIVPFTYKAYNSKNELICEQISARNGKSNEYEEKLILSKFSKDDNIVNLEIYKANKEKITTLYINLTTREVNVEDEEEAIKKISEIELKKFLSYIATFDEGIKKGDQDFKIILAKTLLEKDEESLEEINNMIESLGYEKIPNIYEGILYKVATKNGKQILETIGGIDIEPVTVLSIKDIAYCAGIYNATFNYMNLDIGNSFEVDYSKEKTKEATIQFILNENEKYSKFKIVKYEEKNENNTTENNNEKNNNNITGNTEETNSTIDNQIDNTQITSKILGKWMAENAVNSKGENIGLNSIFGTSISSSNEMIFKENNNFQYGIGGIAGNGSGTYSVNGNKIECKAIVGDTDAYTTFEFTYIPEKDILKEERENLEEKVTITYIRKNTNNESNEKISNDISSVVWKEYNAPGIKFIYPEEFKITEYNTNFLGRNNVKESDISVTLEGKIVGLDEITKEKIDSNMKITIYQPEFCPYALGEKYFATKSASQILNKSLIDSYGNVICEEMYSTKSEWNFIGTQKYDESNKITKNLMTTLNTFAYKTEKGEDYKYGFKILFETTNAENPKVKNVIKYIMNNIYSLSFNYK